MESREKREAYTARTGKEHDMAREMMQRLTKSVCPCCAGSGKIKMMQACATYDAGTVQGPDKYTMCPFCGGKGLIGK